ncbi:polysaccharide deacetylase family protein [Bacillus sp. ISL-7]|uniref:polysaccharide deacetylase family protein n=1 Tax=Bacillus sp. ISL-7 TaxID=2819136 RepID=UPI001BE8173C|nr:polysaccharide deacetylase family protein [Bacillus sp. ISL-7]MBT2738186.1 polysaccharide deacetylase [Bacillus sp. ISL-7]
MGKLKGGWSKGTLIAVIAVVFLFTGIFVSNYFQAKAAGDESKNHQKNKVTNLPVKKNVSAEMIVRNTNDLKLEKELIRKQQDKAVIWSNQQERETSKVPNNHTTNKAVAHPTTKDKTTSQPPTKESIAAPSKPKNTQPRTSGKKIVYLTFDDGPAAFSDKIIALLEKYQFKATFFMIDGNIKRYPEAVKLMTKTGETLGLHSVSHSQKKFYKSKESVLSELTQNRNTLKEVSGVNSFIMRTPYGSVPNMTDEYKKAVKENGYLMWDWNIDSKDWYYKDKRYVNSVINQINQKKDHNGPLVILLHERKETLAYLPLLLDYLKKQGFEGKPIENTTTPIQF